MLEVYISACRRERGHETAYGLLAEAYRRHVGAPMPAVARTAAGKPYFPDGSLAFSLSHTGTAALCAVSDQTVGADAETVRPVRPGLPERVLCSEELDWLARQADRETAFFTLWTGKEAWVKLTGRGPPVAAAGRAPFLRRRRAWRGWGRAGDPSGAGGGDDGLHRGAGASDLDDAAGRAQRMN